MELVKQIYRMTATFPKHEAFGLTSQIRRSAVSIPANIAEGAARQTDKEMVNFLHIAQGSLSELDTQLDIAYELKYIQEGDQQDLDNMMVRIDKMLSGLIAKKRKGLRA